MREREARGVISIVFCVWLLFLRLWRFDRAGDEPQAALRLALQGNLSTRSVNVGLEDRGVD